VRIRWTIIWLAVAVVVAGVGGVVWKSMSYRPKALLRQLRTGRGDTEQLAMQLRAGTGFVPLLLEELRDVSAPVPYRVLLIDELAREYGRGADADIAGALAAMLADTEPAVRKAAVSFWVMRGTPQDNLRLVRLVADPDADVRREVYQLLASNETSPTSGVWAALSVNERSDLAARVKMQLEGEHSPDLVLLGRATLGRAIEILCNEADSARQRGDLREAERLFQAALALDGNNQQAPIRYVRHQLELGGDTASIIELARRYGVVLEVPYLGAFPVIDGDPNEEAWGKAFVTDCFFRTRPDRWFAGPARGKTELRIGWRDNKLFIAVLGYEDDVSKLRTSDRGRDGDTYLDDCVSIYLDPTNRQTRETSFNFIINASGSVTDTYQQDRKFNFPVETAVSRFADRGYWCCEFAISADDLNNSKISETSVWGMSINRNRVGLGTEYVSLRPHFGSALNYRLHPMAVFKTSSPQ
jgi:hypothetical protein